MDEKIREAFESEWSMNPDCKYIEDIDAYVENPVKENISIKYQWFKSGYKSAMQSAQEEIERLKEKLEDTKKFINGIVTWSNCYPKSVFKEPNPVVLNQICKDNGITLDSISAMILRKYTKTWGEEARKVLEKVGE